MICFIVLPLLMLNMIMQSGPSSSRRTLVERLFGLIGFEQRFSSDCLPPRPADNTEVLSQKAPSQGEVVLGAPRGDFPDPGYQGSEAPTGFEFGPQPDTAPEPSMVSDSGRRSLIKGANHLCRCPLSN